MADPKDGADIRRRAFLKASGALSAIVGGAGLGLFGTVSGIAGVGLWRLLLRRS